MMHHWARKMYQRRHCCFRLNWYQVMKWLLVAQAQVTRGSAQLVEWLITSWGKQFVSCSCH